MLGWGWLAKQKMIVMMIERCIYLLYYFKVSDSGGGSDGTDGCA